MVPTADGARGYALLSAILVAVLTAGCTAGHEPAASPAGTVFDLGYRFVVPDGFTTINGSKAWELGSPPHKGAPMFDTFSSGGEGDPWIVVGKRTASGLTLDQWIQQMRETNTVTYRPEECLPVESDKESSLGGAPARMISFHCPIDGPDAIAVQVLAKHGNDGWVAMCYSEREAKGNLPEFEQRCDRWLVTFAYV